MNVATASQPQPLVPSLLPREGWLDGLAGTCLGGWMTTCMVLQIPETVPLSIVATVGLLLAKAARVWGVAVGMSALGYVLAQHPAWLRDDLLLRGGMVLALINIWMLVGLRTRPAAEAAAPAFEAPLQDVERSLMPHSAQVKRDLDRAQAELSAERQRLRALEVELNATHEQLQRARDETAGLAGKLTTVEQQREGLLEELAALRHTQHSLQEELTPMRLEASELRAVLERTVSRSQDLEEQTRLLEDLKETLRKAQEEAFAKQHSLDLQGGQLQEALQQLLQEQEQRAALEALVQGNQQDQQQARENLEGVRQDLERQERVADSLLQKIVELETALRSSQQDQALARLHANTVEELAVQGISVWTQLALQRQKVSDELQARMIQLEQELATVHAAADAQVQQRLSEQAELEAQLLHAHTTHAGLQSQIEALRQQMQNRQEACSALQEERAEMLRAYEYLQEQLLTTQTLAQQRQQELEAAVEKAQRQALHLAQSHHATVEHAMADVQRELEQWKTQAEQGSAERKALQEAVLDAQAQARHAQALLELRGEEAEKLRQQLHDPQRMESLKRASMLERQLAVKEQVIARLQMQQEELPELVRTKHQHLQLREQFEAHRLAAEQLVAQNLQLQEQLFELKERVESPEPSATEAQLLDLLQQTEQECILLEQEAALSSAALRQLV
jgi:chromosome segregation ATPase